ncbi:Peptidase M50B-like [Fragilaria crotonensis]|nr:Peptidase M50B-like [Fragilaria crotonensis]
MSCDLPDACGNDLREESLIAAQQKDDTRSWAVRFFQREKILLGACLVMIILLNFDTGRYILYPFKLLSTWVHEMSHGTAAILVGGKIKELKIFHDGSGSCYYYYDGATWKGAFVSSAGYTGTAFWGCILLLFRRTVLGPTIGTIGFGVAILLSCALYVRNAFGLIALLIEGFAFVLCGWFLPALWLDNLYAFLAATCSMNALLDIKNLYGSSQGYVGGQLSTTDAAAVAEYWGNDYRFWATLWLVFAIVMTLIGLVFAKDAKEMPRNKRQPQYNQEKQVPVSKPTQSTGDYYWAQPV